MTDSNSVGGLGSGDSNTTSMQDIKTKPTNLVDSSELDRMVTESLKDVSSEDDDGDVESDDELMRQLKEITDGPLTVTNNRHEDVTDPVLSTSAQSTVDVLKHRIEMYELAETNAKSCGQNAKVRRLRRGLSRLNDLLSQTKAGEQIIATDIPPEVTTKPPATGNVSDADG